MTIVVADASPIIALTAVGRLDLLHSLFGDITIPEIVAMEVQPSVLALPDWVTVTRTPQDTPTPILSRALDPGERGALALALALNAELLIIDDRDGRREAMRLGNSSTT